MTDLEKMLFIRTRILEGKSKEQARQACNKQAQLDRLNSHSVQFVNSLQQMRILAR